MCEKPTRPMMTAPSMAASMALATVSVRLPEAAFAVVVRSYSVCMGNPLSARFLVWPGQEYERRGLRHAPEPARAYLGSREVQPASVAPQGRPVLDYGITAPVAG